jgi:hypothetical protein
MNFSGVGDPLNHPYLFMFAARILAGGSLPLFKDK